MDIETVAALVFVIIALTAAAYKQRRKDVLYGPYIASPFQQRWNNIAGAMHEG